MMKNKITYTQINGINYPNLALSEQTEHSIGIWGKRHLEYLKGRKTTQKERAEIVEFCIRNNKDYGLTVETYNVSYQQIYQWVKKYEEGGVDKLQDNRGRTKRESELTEVERLKLEIKILEAKNRQLEIENAFIKKLEELKDGGR